MEKKLGLATRDAYGKVLVELGKSHPNLVVMDADLSKSTKSADFGVKFPERFFNVGIMEANMTGVASGLAASGKIPFISSFATFLISKNYDQMRMSIAFPNLNVKLVGSHGGISVGEDGASQMSIEDIALVSTLPNFTAMIPSDQYATEALVRQAADHVGPVYIRTCRPKAPIVHNEKTEFKIGKAVSLRKGKDVTIIANGLLVFEALQAAEDLAKQGIDASVVDMHTAKPLDEELLKAEAKRTGHLVVAEEHQIWGGLGSAVARFVSSHTPCKIEYVAIQDTFAESGKPDELLDKYGLRAVNIVSAVKKVLSR